MTQCKESREEVLDEEICDEEVFGEEDTASCPLCEMSKQFKVRIAGLEQNIDYLSLELDDLRRSVEELTCKTLKERIAKLEQEHGGQK